MSDVDQRLAAAREAAAARAAKRAEAAKTRELLELELEERFEKELGPRWLEFELVQWGDGPVVIALGDSMYYRKLAALKKDPKTDSYHDADLHAIIAPNVKYPDAATFAQWADKRGGLRATCLLAFQSLHEAKGVEQQGK